MEDPMDMGCVPIDRIPEFKKLTLMYIQDTADSKSSELVTKFKENLKTPGQKNTWIKKDQSRQGSVQPTAEPGPSTAQTYSYPRPTDISISDDDSGFEESSDTCISQNEAEPGTDQRLSVPYEVDPHDVDLNAKDHAGKTLSDDEKHAQLNGVVSDKKADMVADVDLNGADKANEAIGLDDSANSYEDSDGTELAPDGTWDDMRNVKDGTVKDVMKVGHECQELKKNVIDELDIPFSNEMSVNTENEIEKMAEKIPDVNSTPQSQMYVSQDNTLIKDYRQFERFSYVRDMNNDGKYTIGADGLIFGGPNILGSWLDGCIETNWKKVQVWMAEDTWSYVGCGISAKNGSIETDVFELPAVEKRLDVKTQKRNLDCDTGEQIHKRRRCCLVQ